MGVRELRLQTGLSQSKFAKMFDVPVSTLKDWEQERRNPPAYVINIISWNFKHIVNIKTIRGVRAITNLKGYKPIEILNPSVLLESEG